MQPLNHTGVHMNQTLHCKNLKQDKHNEKTYNTPLIESTTYSFPLLIWPENFFIQA